MGEIYAYGLRNPWKFSFDIHRDIMLAGDVGQNAIEEIDVIENGGNYGWSHYEGSNVYKDSVPLDGEIISPIYEYGHSLGQSITGGYTYYGESIPSLLGVYVYGDFISGTLWGLWIDEEGQVQNEQILSTDLMIPSFGIDAKQELYILDFNGGIYQLEKAE
jgi:glucose/arabinose dehydrogenase